MTGGGGGGGEAVSTAVISRRPAGGRVEVNQADCGVVVLID